ncbi:MAG: hypothetical protein ACOCXJ_07995, partial [Planctomycetota bacterium]
MIRTGILSLLVGCTATLCAVEPARLLSDINIVGGGLFSEAVLGERLFFAYQDAQGDELWVSDGSLDGTHVFADLVAGPGSSSPRELTRIGDRIYFSALDLVGDRELWVSNGTVGGTRRLVDIDPDGSSAPQDIGPGGDGLLFTASTADHGRELWTVDPASGDARRLSDIRPGAGDGIGIGQFATLDDGTRLFVANDGIHGRELWSWDGSSLRMLPEIVTGTGDPRFGALQAAGEQVFTTADTADSGTELWVATATTWTMPRDIRPGAQGSNPIFRTVVDGRAFFQADDGTHGREVWYSDGTSDGTRMLADLTDASVIYGPSNLGAAHGLCWFEADKPGEIFDGELWVTDGDPANTRMVAELRPGGQGSSSDPQHFVPMSDGRVLFLAQTVAGVTGVHEPWIT